MASATLIQHDILHDGDYHQYNKFDFYGANEPKPQISEMNRYDFMTINSAYSKHNYVSTLKELLGGAYTFTFREHSSTEKNVFNPTEFFSTEEYNVTERYKNRKNRQTIKEIGKLKADWNGDGASPISRLIIDNALLLIDKLCRQPEIFPTSRKSLQFEYEKDNDYLEFELFEEKITVYMEKNEVETEDEFRLPQDENVINDFINKFYGSQ